MVQTGIDNPFVTIAPLLASAEGDIGMKLGRRAVLGGMCGCAAGHIVGGLSLASDITYLPCGLDGTEIRANGTFRPWNGRDPVQDSSGDTEFDRSLGSVLVHMAQFFDVTPDFGFIEETSGANAFATSYSPSGNRDGTIAFGRNLLDLELNKPNGNFAVMAICAHEFGHIRQYGDGYISRIESRLPEFCVELHADFMAGTFLAYWKPMMRPEHLLRIGDTWSQMGSSDFNRPGSHGTTVQRVAAIEAGFFFRDGVRDASLQDLMLAGLEHVERYAE